MHKAETILNALAAVLTGLTTTGASVQRARAWPVSALPALTISKGDDRVTEDINFGFIRREMLVNITAQVKATSNLETLLNTIAVEVYAAVMADITLSGSATNIDLVEEVEPSIEAEQDEPTGSMIMQYLIHYRHSATSAEV